MRNRPRDRSPFVCDRSGPVSAEIRACSGMAGHAILPALLAWGDVDDLHDRDWSQIIDAERGEHCLNNACPGPLSPGAIRRSWQACLLSRIWPCLCFIRRSLGEITEQPGSAGLVAGGPT